MKLRKSTDRDQPQRQAPINPPDEPVWIGHPDWRVDAGAPLTQPVGFRRTIELAAPRGGRIRISATPRYLLWVNGVFVGDGPARSWPWQQCVDEREVGHLLRPGVNHLAVLVPSATEQTAYSPMTRMGFWFDGSFQDGDVDVRVISDCTWKSGVATWIDSHRLFGSLPTAPQEHLNGDPHAWTTAPCDSRWGEPMEFGPMGCSPWHGSQERSLPYLEENESNAPIVWRGRFEDTAQHHPRENLALRFNAAPCKGVPVQLPGGEEFSLAPGEVLAWDVGRTRSVRAGFELISVQGQVRLEVFYSDALGERPSAHYGFGHPSEGMCDTWQPENPVGWLGDWHGRYAGAHDFPLEWGAPKERTDPPEAGTNILWKTALPGWGHSSPVHVNGRIFLTCEPDITVGLDAETGRVLWKHSAGAKHGDKAIPVPSAGGNKDLGLDL